jgi:hypothetical protein
MKVTDSLRHLYLSTKPHGITPQTTLISVLISVRISGPSACITKFSESEIYHSDSVSIGIMLRAGRLRSWGSVPGRGKRFFCYPYHSDRLWSPPNLLHNGYQAWGVKDKGRENDNSSIISAAVKSGGATPPHPQASSWRGA